MICPYCQTENRDDQETCYYCHKDISMLRLIVNKAKHHYNLALEHAERDRVDEAITELKNALDLDASLVNARVVLGTLYARKEQFEDARQAWEQALDSDYRFRKAHDYLHKAGQAEYVFPGMKRLQKVNLWLLATSATLALVLVILIIILALPDRERPQLVRALGIARNDPLVSAATVEELAALSADEDTPPAIVDYARNMRVHIERAWEEDLAIARSALEHDAPLVTLEALNNLLSKDPNQTARTAAEELYAEAGARVADELRRASEAFRTNQLPYDTFLGRAERVLELLPAGAAADQITSLTLEIKQTHLERMLEQARAAVADGTLNEAIALVQEWRRNYPEHVAPLEEVLDQRMVTRTAMVEVQIEGLIESGQFDEASRVLADLGSLYKHAGRPAPEEVLAGLRDAIGQARMAAARSAAEQAFAEQRWEDFLELTRRPTDLAADEAGLAALGEQRARALQEVARERWRWFDERKLAFQSLSITTEEAAQAIQWYGPVMEALPPDLTWARGPLTFYTAAARLKLGDPQEARKLLARVHSDFDDSYVVDLVNQFQETFARELGLAEKPPAPAASDEPTTGAATPPPAAEATPAADEEAPAPAEKASPAS